MGGLTLQYILLAIVAVLVLAVVMPSFVRTYLRFRGKRLVVCPETQRPAAVDVDARYAAWTGALIDEHGLLRLKDCSRWPERQNCGQECLAQIEGAPQGCLLRTIVENWYANKVCALCGKPFGRFHWHEHQPALMNPNGETVEWQTVPPEKLPETMFTHKPVCWSCHLAETFRREHPELVVDRPPH